MDSERYEARLELGRRAGGAATTYVMVESDKRDVVAALVDAVKAAYEALGNPSALAKWASENDTPTKEA
jgi:threonine dehydrogenase-like Zn-dependent dehydrogenase